MIIYGKQIAQYALKHHAAKIQKVMLAKEVDKRLFSAFAGLGVPLERLDAKKAQALARGGNHQGFLLEITAPLQSEFAALKEAGALLVLCGITDVGNIGALARSAYALGMGGVVICGLRELKLEGAIRASAGALLDLPFCVRFNAQDVANELKFAGFTLMGAAQNQKPGVKNQSSKVALFLGAEDSGLGGKLMAKMDEIVTILHRREFDSLNVSAAGAILMDRILNERA